MGMFDLTTQLSTTVDKYIIYGLSYFDTQDNLDLLTGMTGGAITSLVDQDYSDLDTRVPDDPSMPMAGQACAELTDGDFMVTIYPCELGSGDDIALEDPCACLNNTTTHSNGQFAETIVVDAGASGLSLWLDNVTSFNVSPTEPNGGLFSTTSPAPPGTPVSLLLGAANNATYIGYGIGTGSIAGMAHVVGGSKLIDAFTDGIDNDMMNGIDDAEEEGKYYFDAIHIDSLGFVATILVDFDGDGISDETLTFTNEGCHYPIPSLVLPELEICSKLLPYDMRPFATAVRGLDDMPATEDDTGDDSYNQGTDYQDNMPTGMVPLPSEQFYIYELDGITLATCEDGTPITYPIVSLPTCMEGGYYLIRYYFNEDDDESITPGFTPGTEVTQPASEPGCTQCLDPDVEFRLIIVDCGNFPWTGNGRRR